jgi:hypothetical protein
MLAGVIRPLCAADKVPDKVRETLEEGRVLVQPHLAGGPEHQAHQTASVVLFKSEQTSLKSAQKLHVRF